MTTGGNDWHSQWNRAAQYYPSTLHSIRETEFDTLDETQFPPRSLASTSRPSSMVLPEGFTVAKIRREATSASLLSAEDLYHVGAVNPQNCLESLSIVPMHPFAYAPAVMTASYSMNSRVDHFGQRRCSMSSIDSWSMDSSKDGNAGQFFEQACRPLRSSVCCLPQCFNGRKSLRALELQEAAKTAQAQC